jgi:hypothetical protein
VNSKAIKSIVFGATAAAIVACGGEKAPGNGDTGTTTAAAPAEDFRKAQQRYADSVFGEVKGAGEVVKRLGDKYAVPSLRLRDSVALLVGQSRCFDNGRQVDPYLQGAATIWVNMSSIGSDLIQVLESDTKWTSNAGTFVTSCINKAATKWKFDISFGKPAGYVVQVQFKTDSAATANPGK